MDRITEVTEEFYGSWSSKKPFNSLEKLEFAEMPEWKQWHVLGSGEFPILEKLSIENCPKLMRKLPENLCSLTELRISECSELNLDTSQLEGMKQIVELDIYCCNSLTSFLPSTLKRITISTCQNLKLDPPVGEMSYCNMFLEELELQECDCIDDISPELLPRAHNMNVYYCHNLTRFLIPTATETLFITNCGNLEILSVARGTLPSAMTLLVIDGCWKLKRLPDHMQELLPSLKELILKNCPEIESFPEGGLPFNLQKLEIRNCTKLVNGRKEWRLPRLTYLRIIHDGSDEEMEHWELPSSIKRLTISNLKTLSSKVLKSLTSLECLHTYDLPQIQSLLEEGLPSSLTKLYLSQHHNLPSLSESALPSSLSHLHIWECQNLRSLSTSALPSSLSHLTIQDCPNLQSLSESALPSSLSQLTIQRCPNLQSLSVKGIPSSLSKLDIHKCPLLSPLLEFNKGEYWPNIAQIPIIEINEECL